MSKSTSNLLKIIAMITMLIDHIGVILYPEFIFLRIIGRISFPLFAYLLITGFKNTKNINLYLYRLLFFGIISQIPYYYMLPGRFNVILYFFIALLSLKYFKKNRIYLPIVVGIFTEYFKFSYGLYGIITIYIFYILYENKPNLSIAFIILNFIYIPIFNNYIQALSIISLPLLFINIDNFNIKMNKYIAYLFYPLHLTILLLINHYGLL